MVRWQGVMWRRLTLTLLLASIASSSSSSSGNKNKGNRSNSTCPESCRCSRIQPIETVNNNNNNNNNNNINNRKKSSEVHCKGKVPEIEYFPSDSRRLIVEGTKPHEIINMLLEVESRISGNDTRGISERVSEQSEGHQSNNNDGLALQEFVFINCSLRHLNISLQAVSTSIFGKTLNLSSNEFADTDDLSIGEGDRLERLDLSNNRLSRIKNEAFAKYSHLLLLNLRRNAIEVVEERGFAGLGSLESLDLSDNRLATLDDGAFVPLCLLQKLNLSGNKLVGVLGGGHQWFDALGRLKELDVSRNGQETNVNINNSGNNSTNDKLGVRKNKTEEEAEERGKSLVALEALPIGLKVLRLAENPLTDVELSLVLGSGRRLETVDASRIGLDRVPSALTRSVRALTLSGNKISSIRSGDLDSYPLLRLVDFSYNIVNNVEEDAFGRLENLEKLDLSNNLLTEIPQSLPSSLLHLLLSHNSIERLTIKDLQGVTKLKKLVINKNAIKEIELGSMSQLGLLAELDISDNPIKQLPANTFGGPRSLVSVRMSGLESLEWDREKRADMAFPVPAPEGLVTLDLSRSPALAAQLLADEAALSACKSLRRLNLSQTNLTTLRSDLAYLLPQLHTLGLSDNQWNCTSDNSEEILWLAEWIKQHEEIQPPGKCATDDLISSSRDTIFLSQLTSLSLGIDSDSPPATEPITHPYTSTGSPHEYQHLSSIEIDLSKNEPTTRILPETLVFDKTNRNDEQEKSSTNTMPNSLTYNKPNIINTTEASSIIVTSGSVVFDIDNVTTLENSTTANNYSIRVSETENPMEKSDVSIETSINSTTLRNDKLLDSNDDYSLNTSEGIGSTSSATVFERNVELINNTVAEELIGREEFGKSLSRTSEITSSAIGDHPGMLVIAGAVLGAIVALSVVLSRRVTLATGSRRQSIVLLNRESYHRHENIEAHSLAHQQQPIITDLW